jgi:nicotinamidase-related amidase
MIAVFREDAMELDPHRTAIVAVHMQRDIVTAEGAFGGIFAAQASSRDVIGVTGKLLMTVRDAGATVVYTRVAWQPGYLDLVANSPLLAMVVQQNGLVEGSDMAQIVPELAPEAGDLVVTHQRVSGFSASQLDTLLRSRGVDTVLFCGVATNISVEGTARQASDLGYRTAVIADACSAADEPAHDAALASLGLLAEIVTSVAVIEALTRGAAASR